MNSLTTVQRKRISDLEHQNSEIPSKKKRIEEKDLYNENQLPNRNEVNPQPRVPVEYSNPVPNNCQPVNGNQAHLMSNSMNYRVPLLHAVQNRSINSNWDLFELYGENIYRGR